MKAQSALEHVGPLGNMNLFDESVYKYQFWLN